jgi:hypothetical protein
MSRKKKAPSKVDLLWQGVLFTKQGSKHVKWTLLPEHSIESPATSCSSSVLDLLFTRRKNTAICDKFNVP